MFEVNNKNIITTSLTPFSSDFIVDLEQVNVSSLKFLRSTLIYL